MQMLAEMGRTGGDEMRKTLKGWWREGGSWEGVVGEVGRAAEQTGRLAQPSSPSRSQLPRFSPCGGMGAACSCTSACQIMASCCVTEVLLSRYSNLFVAYSLRATLVQLSASLLVVLPSPRSRAHG